jgi:glycosyltransferase involved in cell wall biosynthesis
VQALSELATDPARRRAMAEASRRHMLHGFTVERMASETAGLYREAMERHKRR